MTHVDVEKQFTELSRRQHDAWQRKALLRRVYSDFFRDIAARLRRDVPGPIAELGSGSGRIREVIPDCICTDAAPNPWVERVENAYALTFRDAEVSNVILFDVFHHLRYPGSALAEWKRVLAPGGRVILFEPFIGALGWLVYGVFHREGLSLTAPITWQRDGAASGRTDDYGNQAAATRVFFGGTYEPLLAGWRIVERRRMSALAYVSSGGYGRVQLYPEAAYPLVKGMEKILDRFPWLFGTRVMIVLEKTDEENMKAEN